MEITTKEGTQVDLRHLIKEIQSLSKEELLQFSELIRQLLQLRTEFADVERALADLMGCRR
jgi:hypothetical protein